MAKTPTHTEVFVLKISKEQKQTLDKLRAYNVPVAQFIRQSIKEKINREHSELKPKPKKQYCPF